MNVIVFPDVGFNRLRTRFQKKGYGLGGGRGAGLAQRGAERPAQENRLPARESWKQIRGSQSFAALCDIEFRRLECIRPRCNLVARRG